MSGLWLEQAPPALASKSEIRAHILREAGLAPEVRPSQVDERDVEARLGAAETTPPGVARALAGAKAAEVSGRYPDRLVIGADQTLALGAERFTKPVDAAAGREQLRRLSGRTHSLFSGVALARKGQVLWSFVDEARLTMRPLSGDFIEAYLAAAGPDILKSVGGYQFEGLGAHLFDHVSGDFRTILGLPLLPLLSALRDLGAIRA
ncbi:Maf family protein [Hansschlegelia beijingensis]|uniref:Nucleoside triphosphate pyrophosphatase n=1 Tax=Hansschlegelia beijingensis TaxID=1133344 RepID=A0A7W6D1S0_9HYPH|nr:Maf family protein [Hansschlegelia beijingensis]MBB3973031.1 septum formation protein [Hansschlegelia beijingensis]